MEKGSKKEKWQFKTTTDVISFQDKCKVFFPFKLNVLVFKQNTLMHPIWPKRRDKWGQK